MSEPLRTETSRTPELASKAEREAKIEQLLLAGLDHYFAGQYEQAITVWTRALFFDRNHARARAYIERARSAQAERQRETEALLHDGAAAVQRGDGVEARRLLTAAMASAGTSDEVLTLLDRVERLERSTSLYPPVPDGSEPPRLTLDVPAPTRRRAVSLAALGGLLLVIVGAGVLASSATRPEWGDVVDRALSRQLGRVPAGAGAAAPRELALLPLPRRAEVALARARALISGGKLRDALAVLDTIRPTDPERAEADRLKADVQRQLIAIGPMPGQRGSASTDGVAP